MLDADYNFLITFLLNTSGLVYDVNLTMRLTQRQKYHRLSILGTSYLPIITATIFGINVVEYTRNRGTTSVELGYLVRVKSKTARSLLINYLDNYSLLSSKYLDYLDWRTAHGIVGYKGYRTYMGTTKLIELKSSMNTKRI
jgi:hypothetical protein